MFDTLIREVASRFGLGDKALPLVQMLLAYMTNKDTGGLAGFVDKFKSAGLGAMASSWLGGNTSSAQAITPTQVEQLMGGQAGLIGALTSKLGIGAQSASSALAFLLPAVMGKLTPGGSIPTSIPHDVMGMIGSAKGMLGSGAAAAAGAVGAGVSGVAGAGKAAGGGLMKWLPWIVAGAAALFLLNYCAKPAVDATKNAASATVDAAKTAATATVDATKSAANVATGAAGAVAGAAGAAVGAATGAAATVAGAAVDATKAAATVATDAAKAVAEAIPNGAGALTALIDGVPALKVYFDTGKTALSPDFADKSKAVLDYLKANATSKAVVSGFNDPTGNAAANAELSKNRALAVAAALKAAGLSEDRVILEKPVAGTVPAGASNAEARRVEITIRK